MASGEIFDVVVVGFGPTGATLANLLGRDGHRTLVVERAPQIYTLPRAVHFDHEVMRIFQSIRLAERILPHTGPVEGYEFKNAEGKLLMGFELGETLTSQGWQADYMFHQPSLEAVLREGATAHRKVEVQLGQELVRLEQELDGVTLGLRSAEDGRQTSVRARFVVGCDGASSATREQVGLETEDLEFDEPWLVVDATTSRPVEELGFPRVPLQHCDPRRPTTAIPVMGPYLRWEFMLLPGEGPEMQEPARVRALVSEWVDPDAIEIIRSAVYRFHALIGRRWRAGRVLIAGDAAHQMPPFLGQGMCAGIRDADNLAWKLGMVLDGRAGEGLLDSYQRERGPHVRSVIGIAVEMGRIICTQDPEIAKARDAQMLSGAGGVAGASGGTPASMPALPGLSEGLLEPAPRHPLTGELALQATVRDGQGREGLLDDLAGPGFTLLWREATSLSDRARATLERLHVRQITFGSTVDPKVLRLDDPTHAYGAWLDRHGADAVLIRPDHVVFGVASGARDVGVLVDALTAGLAAGADAG